MFLKVMDHQLEPKWFAFISTGRKVVCWKVGTLGESKIQGSPLALKFSCLETWETQVSSLGLRLSALKWEYYCSPVCF